MTFGAETADHREFFQVIHGEAFDIPNLEAIQQAALRIADHALRTPVMTCTSLDRMTGARLSFKCENFQKVGAFKFRGAANAVLSLPPDKKAAGVVTHSSGNHAQALALAAQLEGLKAFIVMPENAPTVKIAAVREYGADVILCQPTLEAREAGVRDIIRQTGAELIHPYDDVRIITGQATCALEFIEQVPDMDTIMVPVGGGGLLSGTALATRYLAPEIRVMAAEPELADDACQSFQTGKLVAAGPPRTIADGLLTSLGEITFPVILEHVDGIVTVSEENIIAAMRSIWERMKIVVEPSGAVPLAAVLEHPDVFKNRHVGIILSGGNVDFQKMLPIFG
jgi:threonine dehydratase